MSEGVWVCRMFAETLAVRNNLNKHKNQPRCQFFTKHQAPEQWEWKRVIVFSHPWKIPDASVYVNKRPKRCDIASVFNNLGWVTVSFHWLSSKPVNQILQIHLLHSRIIVTTSKCLYLREAASFSFFKTCFNVFLCSNLWSPERVEDIP